MSLLDRPGFRAWLVVALLCVVGCLNYLDRVMLTTMRLSVEAAIPMTDAQFGLLTSAFLWVYAGLSPFAGFIADRFGRARIVITSLLVWSLITWLTSQARTYDQLLLTRALMGVSEACYIPAALALIADYHGTATRSLAIGIHMVGIAIGSGLGGLGGVLAEHRGWTYPFTLFGLAGLAYSLVLMLFLRDPAKPQGAATLDLPPKIRFGAALKSLTSRGSFFLALLYWGLLGIAGWAIVGWLPTFFGEKYHLSQGTAGLSATGYLQAAACVGMLLGGIWADRWSRRNARGPILVPAIALCIATPAILVGSHSPWMPLAIIGFMINSAAGGVTDSNMMPILCLVTDAKYRATGYGILNFFGCTFGGLTIYLGGVLRDRQVNIVHIFEGGAVGLLICSGLLLLMKPKPTSG